MVGSTKVGRRRFLAAMAGISAAVLTEQASAQSVDWRNLSGTDTDPTDQDRSDVQSVGSSRNRTRRPNRPKTLCFLEGTRIATPNGHCLVEELSVGQLVLTVAGQSKPIKWLGQCRRAADATGAWDHDDLPITIEAHAIADNVPSRDLHLSPEHALYLDGILIPAKHLVNGTTIYPMSTRGLDAVNYYHLELDCHDAVWAEGAAAETYRDTGTRSAFDSSEEQDEFRPSRTITKPFAPLVALHGRRNIIASHLRSAGSLLIDRRSQFEVTRDRIFERAVAIEEARGISLAA